MSASNFTGPVPAPKDTQTPLNVFITGASRGIGLELTRQYAAANAKSQIFAGVRDAKAAGVVALVKEFPNVVPIVQDASSDASIHASVQEVEKRVHSLDILINNGQTRHTHARTHLHSNCASAAVPLRTVPWCSL